MGDTMIERVARALADVNELDFEEYPDLPRALARAAILAMREPTDAMVRAAYNDMRASEPLENAYRAMIDAALKNP